MTKRLRNGMLAGLMCILLVQWSHAFEGGGITWVDDIEEAKVQAKESGRPMLIFVTMNGCYYCSQMKQTTLVDPELVAEVQENFVPAVVNQAQNRAWVERLGIRAFPTTLLATPDGKIKEFLRGYVAPSRLRESMQKIRSLN